MCVRDVEETCTLGSRLLLPKTFSFKGQHVPLETEKTLLITIVCSCGLEAKSFSSPSSGCIFCCVAHSGESFASLCSNEQVDSH